MGKMNFLVLSNDQATGCLFSGAIHQRLPGSLVLKANDTYQALQVLMGIVRQGKQAENESKKEVRVLLDMDMPYLEAFVFLNELYQTKFPFALRVYLLEGSGAAEECRPDISRYRGVCRRLEKEAISTTVEKIVNDRSENYFHHARNARFPLDF